MNDWTAGGVVAEGDAVDVGGGDPWRVEGRQVSDRAVELPHPSYPGQRHRMWVYEIGDEGRPVRFAAGWAQAFPGDKGSGGSPLPPALRC